MPSKKWLIALAIPLVVIYVFAFSYIYAVAYKIPAMARNESWLAHAGIAGTPQPSLEHVLSPAMVTAISKATDPQEKETLLSLRAAAENAVNGAHGEGFLIGILSLSVVWVPMLYRWKRRRNLAALQTRAAAPAPVSVSPGLAVSRCVNCGAVIGEGLSYCYECRSKEPA